MSKQKYNNPKTITIMAAATVGGVTFAGWNIRNSMASPSPPTAATASVHPSDSAARSAASSHQTEGASAPLDRVNTASAAQTEDELSPLADPFVPLPEMARSAVISTSPPAPAHTETAVVSPLPSFPMGRTGMLSAVPFGQAPGNAPTAPALESMSEPKLVGTLFGDRPSAVFSTDKKLTVVPVGGKLGVWKVVAVNHDSVSVKGPRGTLRLKLGSSQGLLPMMRDTSVPVSSSIQARSYVSSLVVTAFDPAPPVDKTPIEPKAYPLFPPKSAPPADDGPISKETITKP